MIIKRRNILLVLCSCLFLQVPLLYASAERHLSYAHVAKKALPAPTLFELQNEIFRLEVYIQQLEQKLTQYSQNKEDLHKENRNLRFKLHLREQDNEALTHRIAELKKSNATQAQSICELEQTLATRTALLNIWRKGKNGSFPPLK